eukprot:TRINITY_DN93382_c0_g1_i1.p1 TRINITY_DN93382_c0_g1~~TRINITY_DN93382_c0_g1_i1.p1  ORF type:complete len:293 (+),score=22.77 TRINITY_DN93382_c0_g1_i1:52-930(+)
MGASRSVQLEPVRDVLHALGSNSIDEMLGVRRCTQWNVHLQGQHGNALGLAPQSCSVEGRDRGCGGGEPLKLDDADLSDLFREMTAEEQAKQDAKRNRKLEDYEDCEVQLVLCDDIATLPMEAGIVVTELVRALASNRTIESLFVQMGSCSRALLSELTTSLKSNSNLRSLEMEVCDYVAFRGEDEEEVCKAIAQSGCLRKLSVVHGIGHEEHELDLGTKILDALRCNRCAAAIATQLGQVCRLGIFPGSSAKFKCPSFRLCLLSYWLAPGALPAHVQRRVLREPGVGAKHR